MSPFPSLPHPLPFPFLPIPYPFRRLLRRLIRVCHNLIVCAVCAKILKAGNLFSSIFCERFFLLFASPWLLLTDGDLLTAYSTLSSVFCKQLFIVYLTIVSFGDLLTTGLHQPMVSIGCAGLLGTITVAISNKVTIVGQRINKPIRKKKRPRCERGTVNTSNFESVD